MTSSVKEKPKGPLGKLKEAVDDKEEQLQYLGTLTVSYTHLRAHET